MTDFFSNVMKSTKCVIQFGQEFIPVRQIQVIQVIDKNENSNYYKLTISPVRSNTYNREEYFQEKGDLEKRFQDIMKRIDYCR